MKPRRWIKKKPKKDKPPTWWKKQCVQLAVVIAKERDKYICQKCGKKVEGTNAHGSHIYNKGTYTSMSADSDNLQTMCFYCHMYWWHRNPLEAAEWFKTNFPDLFKTLRERSKMPPRSMNWKKRYDELQEEYKRYE